MLPDELLHYLCLFLSVVDLQLFSHVNQELRKVTRVCYRHCWEPCDVQRDSSYKTEIRLVWRNVTPEILETYATYALKQVYMASKACRPPVCWSVQIHSLRLPSHLMSLEGYTLPLRLHTLILGFYIDEALDSITWPVGLKKLVLGYHFNQPLKTLPEALEELCLGRHFNKAQWEDITWPRTLKTLDVRHYPWPELLPIPATLQHIIFGHQAFERYVFWRGNALPLGLRVELVR